MYYVIMSAAKDGHWEAGQSPAFRGGPAGGTSGIFPDQLQACRPWSPRSLFAAEKDMPYLCVHLAQVSALINTLARFNTGQQPLFAWF
jgi:hypothetical protein